MKLAERGTHRGRLPGLWVREVRRLDADGRQISILSTNFAGDAASPAVALIALVTGKLFQIDAGTLCFRRSGAIWNRRESAAVTVLNPAWRELNRQIHGKPSDLRDYRKRQAGAGLNQPLSEANVGK